MQFCNFETIKFWKLFELFEIFWKYELVWDSKPHLCFQFVCMLIKIRRKAYKGIHSPFPDPYCESYCFCVKHLMSKMEEEEEHFKKSYLPTGSILLTNILLKQMWAFEGEGILRDCFLRGKHIVWLHLQISGRTSN